MELPFHPLLQHPPGALLEIKKIYDLDRPERLNEALDLLEEWIKKQKHFVKRDFSHFYLFSTLISCKGSVEKVKKQLDSICTMKTLIPRLFSKTNVREELLESTTIAMTIPLPKMTEQFYRVMMLKVNPAFQSYHCMQYYQCGSILCEYLRIHDCSNGLVTLADLRNINIVDMISKVNAADLQQHLTMLIEGYGARLRHIYLLSDSKVIDLLVTFIKQFLSQKIVSRIQVIANIEDLPNYIPKVILPLDYGGTERSYETLTREWVDALSTEEHVSYMKMMNKACTDESLRQIGQFNADYMGMPGSFRHLSVD